MNVMVKPKFQVTFGELVAHGVDNIVLIFSKIYLVSDTS